MERESNRPVLTPEVVARAERREGLTHPVITIINRHLPEITELNNRYSGVEAQQQQSFIRENYGFLADGLANAGNFSLSSENIISIWSFAQEVFPQENNYHGRALAGMVTSAYLIQGLSDQSWKTLPRHYLETLELPETVNSESNVIQHFQNRISDINNRMTDIYTYLYGGMDTGPAYLARLGIRAEAGDAEAAREQEEIQRYHTEHRNELLSDINDSFAPHIINLSSILESL
jgi:hypothetical protein